jgi:hypothetical protein
VEVLVIESCEPCATCGEVTPHRRRRWAPRRLLAGLVLLLAVAPLARGPLTDDVPGAATVAVRMALLLPVAWGLWQADRARRWDLACTRCRSRATACRPRLLGPFTTFDPF